MPADWRSVYVTIYRYLSVNWEIRKPTAQSYTYSINIDKAAGDFLFSVFLKSYIQYILFIPLALQTVVDTNIFL